MTWVSMCQINDSIKGQDDMAIETDPVTCPKGNCILYKIEL